MGIKYPILQGPFGDETEENDFYSNDDCYCCRQLRVSDNGRGLPGDFDTESDKCGLGLKLIKGLTGDLDGMFSIESDMECKFVSSSSLLLVYLKKGNPAIHIRIYY